MGAGTLALTMAWLLLGQAPGQAPDELHTNQRSLRIPINFTDGRRTELRELLLFASWDQGRNYQQVAAVLPDKDSFLFEARNDGTCWLKVAVINSQGKQEPENILLGPPDRKIVIDTMKPVVRAFTAQRQGDEVTVAWEILESYFDPQGFRLEYQPKDSQSFPTTIQATPGLTGQTRFRPTTAGPLAVRLSVKDLGGNQSFASAEVSGGINTAAFNPPAGPTPPPNNLVPAVIPPPAATPTVGNFATTLAAPPPLEAVKPPAPNAWAPTNPATNPPSNPPVTEIKERLVATSQAPPSAPTPPPVAPTNNLAPPVTRKPLPPLKYVNHPEVVLEYVLAKVGKSGIGSVDLWWTQNNGQSWELYAVDPDIKGSTQNGTYQRTVELPGEGVYGFILVVKSRAGLGKALRRAGDVPDIRVEVDTVPPVAKLYSPTPDPQIPGHLVLKWTAEDTNLKNNPITLEWAENREGPWNPIAVNIPNTNKHSWPLPERLPVQVYMRLRMHDEAGNESIAVTQEPQLVDLSEPEGTLVNVTVTPRRP